VTSLRSEAGGRKRRPRVATGWLCLRMIIAAAIGFGRSRKNKTHWREVSRSWCSGATHRRALMFQPAATKKPIRPYYDKKKGFVLLTAALPVHAAGELCGMWHPIGSPAKALRISRQQGTLAGVDPLPPRRQTVGGEAHAPFSLCNSAAATARRRSGNSAARIGWRGWLYDP
jgi:hypothetical protein